MNAMPRLGAGGHGNRQRGAVLLLVTFSLIVIFGFAALALDVGRMYIVKSQLQNAADAGALRAALMLDTGQSLTTAGNEGRAAALKNPNLLATAPLIGSNLTVEAGPGPVGPWFSATGTGNPNGYYFAKVTATKTDIPTIFARFLGILDADNGTAAIAVAGRYHIDIMPLAICAPDLGNCPNNTPGGTCGLTTGLSYPVSDVNPIGPGTFFWVDPEAKGPGCTGCKFTSADDLRPYLCSGRSGPAVSGLTGSVVCTNTGKSSGPAFSAIDSRFGDYASAGQCTPTVGPPDTNVMQYVYCDDKKGNVCPNNKAGVLVADWMKQPVPNVMNGHAVVNSGGQAQSQAAAVISRGGDPQPPAMNIDKEGVVWAFTRPATPLSTDRDVNSAYPTNGAPYAQTDPKYHFDPPSMVNGKPVQAVAGRRIIHMLIVKCSATGGNCRDAQVQAIGEFLLTRKTNDSNEMYVEFSRIVPVDQFPTEIKLYR